MANELDTELLKLAADCFPAFCRYKFKEIEAFNHQYPIIYKASRDDLWRAVKYLEGLDLLVVDSQCSTGPGIEGVIGFIKATSKGIDFIKKDGGISADLNVTTIKFHRDAVVVLEDLFALSNMTAQQQAEAKSTLSEMKTESLKTVVQAVTTAGLAALNGLALK